MSNKFDINCERGCIFSVDETTGEPIAELTKGGFKLNATDWTDTYRQNKPCKLYEVRFKNTRKGIFENIHDLPLNIGDIVAVEGNPGHDIGIISMSEDMVRKQMRSKRFSPKDLEFKKIYRVAKPYDIERWQEAISLEHSTMIKSRQITAALNLNMKIGDVEYQGDRVKAIFYYIADERVDFRELIKILADEFKIRIEMKQIGARQEAGRIGGIGSCGREICCSSFVTNFVSVTTNSARFQDILLTPQKLAGQCGKLKCCLNFEVDNYIDARKGFPKLYEPLHTLVGDYFLLKTDIFKREMTFSTDPHLFINTKVLSVETVRDIIAQNRKGVKVDDLISEIIVDEDESPDYKDVIGDESISRFDQKIIKKSKQRNNRQNKQKTPRRNEENKQNGEERKNNPRVRTGEKAQNGERGEKAERAERAPRTDKPRGERPPRSNKPRGERPPRGEQQNAQAENKQVAKVEVKQNTDSTNGENRENRENRSNNQRNSRPRRPFNKQKKGNEKPE